MKYIANPVMADGFKITEVGNLSEQGLALSIDREQDSIVFASYGMRSRMEPAVGDYWVIQEDGYTYLNPKEVFERKYRPLFDGDGILTVGYKTHFATDGSIERMQLSKGDQTVSLTLEQALSLVKQIQMRT